MDNHKWDEEIVKRCMLCPRNCGVNRQQGQTGYCGQTAAPRAARAALHYWEEPCISGTEGSGTVFFSGCVLRCVYCQNHNIAMGRAGKELDVDRLAEIFMELQDKKANNINLVTPTHFVPQIAQALERAHVNGLRIPVVYNTGSYELVETLKRLEGLVDIYLPDLKYRSEALGKKYSNAPDYFSRACEAIREMVRQTGVPVFERQEADFDKGFDCFYKDTRDYGNGSDDWQGLMKRGVIVRHLALPGCIEDSKEILDYLHGSYGNDIFISILNQYTPVTPLEENPELKRKLSRREYDRLVDYAIRIGVENGFIQEGKTADESFIPEFDCEGI